ncbi:MAG: NTPase, partial [Chloroflexi bacterium]|nr:NTPase [Chloroflexota bacterium]
TPRDLPLRRGRSGSTELTAAGRPVSSLTAATMSTPSADPPPKDTGNQTDRTTEVPAECVSDKPMRRVCLLSGPPGVGKTTLIREAISKLSGGAGGFYTREIRRESVRQGFEIVTLEGSSAILAHVDIRGQHRVGKYGVDINNLNNVGVSALHKAVRDCDIVVIDEIGKMELFSPMFREAVLETLDSARKVLGTIMLSPHPWADQIKNDPRVALLMMSRANRDRMLSTVSAWLNDRLETKRGG